VWNQAKEELMKRGMISEKNKKKQDVQMVMRLIKNFLEIAMSSKFEGNTLEIER